jgi:integrase/recombinase XerD
MMLKKPVAYITIDELESLKRACDIVFERSAHTENDEWIRDRDKLLLSVMWATGARITDVLWMSTELIDFKNHTIKFLVRKRKDKERSDKQFWHTVNLDMETLSEIMDYMQIWSVKGYLFRSYRTPEYEKHPMTRQAINAKMKVLCVVAGIRNIHPHMTRHGIAMHIQAQGVPVELISYHLAHSSTAITLSIYARLDANQERKMFDALGVRIR